MVNTVSGGSGPPLHALKPAATSGAESANAAQASSRPASVIRPDFAAAAALTSVSAAGITRDMAKSPPVDASRVAALKAEIASGRYTVDADKIAAAMIRSEQTHRSS